MSRRGNNEGTIYKRKDGRWTAAVGLENGSRKTFYGRTRQDVSAKLTAALQTRQNGLALPKEKKRLDQFLEEWLRDSAKPSVRRTTYEGYERIVRLHVSPALGQLRLARLTPQHIAKLYRALLDKGLAPKTVRLIHAMLHRALRQAVRWGLLAVNPADSVDAPRIDRREFRTLDLAETRTFLSAAASDRLSALYVVALTTGLRQGELLGLRWSDVDLDRAILAVRQQVMKLSGEWVYSEPKTSKGRRTVALPGMTVTALRQHKVRQAEERLRCGEWEDHDLVFPNLVGRPIEKQNLMRRSFRPILQHAGLPPIRFHDLRHSAATLLLGEGVHPKVVQERLGHSTISVTMDTYSHVMPTLQRDAADRLERALTRR
jgi:integrase